MNNLTKRFRKEDMRTILSQEKTAEILNAAKKKENHTHRMGIPSVETQAEEVRLRLQSLNESLDKNQSQRCPLYRQYAIGISQLLKIYATLQSEEAVRQDGCSTSLQPGEKEAERYISECLEGLLRGSRGTNRIPSHVTDYRVVRPLPDGTCSVSLFQIHLILQDNFPDSSLCKLFNIMLGCSEGMTPKTITF